MSRAARRIFARGLTVALAVALWLGATAPGPARAQSADDALATIAMLEDTRVPDGSRVTAYLAPPHPLPVVLRAARALARLQDSTTVGPLAERLRADERPEVRREAAFALGQIGHRAAYAPLSEAAERDADPEVRALALEALGKVNDRRATSLLTRALADTLHELRREAAIALWRLGDSTAVGPLLRALGDERDEVRAYAIWALEKIVDPARIAGPVAARARDRSWLVRTYVARTLGRQGTSVRLDTLLALLEDGEVRVRANAARALTAIADSTAAPALVRRLADPHPHIRELAAVALGKLRDPSVAEALRGLQRDPEPAVRAASAEPLATLLSDSTAFAALRPLLADPHERVRAAAFNALGLVEGRGADAVLAGTMSSLPPVPLSALERAVKAGVLARRKTPAARTQLLAMLAEDRDPGVVASAAEGLGEIGGDAAVAQALVASIEKNRNPNEPDVEIAALDALAKLKSNAGEPAARSALRSTNPLVRQAGRALLDSLYGVARGATLAAAAPGPPAWQAAPIDSYRTVSPRARRAFLETARGEIEIALFPEDAPRTVANFARLAERGYFNGLSFHRVVPNFVVQDGDPTGTGWGGPGYAIRCEYNRRRYGAGAVGMALAGKDTGGSQWFITHAPQPHLDGRYTIFGQVMEGWEALTDITLGDRIERIRIER